MKGDARKSKRKQIKTNVLLMRKIKALKRLEEILRVKFSKDEKWQWIYQISTRKFWRKMQQTKQRIGYGV